MRRAESIFCRSTRSARACETRTVVEKRLCGRDSKTFSSALTRLLHRRGAEFNDSLSPPMRNFLCQSPEKRRLTEKPNGSTIFFAEICHVFATPQVAGKKTASERQTRCTRSSAKSFSCSSSCTLARRGCVLPSRSTRSRTKRARSKWAPCSQACRSFPRSARLPPAAGLIARDRDRRSTSRSSAQRVRAAQRFFFQPLRRASRRSLQRALWSGLRSF